ncbi:rhomboid family intramembrane serine protease [Luteococcus peritonei]
MPQDPAQYPGAGYPSPQFSAPQQEPYQVQAQPLASDPVSRTRPRPQLAVVTWTIIALCVATWLGELMLPGFYEQVALSPALGEHEPWRFITSAFAHSRFGITHIAFNMLALYSVGRSLELSLGRARFAALYLVSALAGGVGFVLLAFPGSATNPLGVNWSTGVVGASGAVFGLFGAMVVLYRHAGVSMQSLGIVLALNALISFTVPGIAWQSHLGGFLAGLVTGWLMLSSTKATWRGKPDRTWLWVAAVTAALVLMLVVKYVVS